jgi:tRNA dimethylallyltransferase
MSGLGYKQVGAFIRGEVDLATAVQRMKYDTHHFARHQYNWFSLGDERIQWFDITQDPGRCAADLVSSFVARQGRGGS